MTERYQKMFAQLKTKNQGAFVPFLVLGDPNREESLEAIEALIRGGADALELGIPFSDPIADGPTIQKADLRALAGGTRPREAWQIISQVRSNHPDIPIGLLVYANLVWAPGLDLFYRQAQESGVDSVLVADVPTLEAETFVCAATNHQISPVLIAAPNTNIQQLQKIVRLSRSYTYVVARSGVTGVDQNEQKLNHELLGYLKQLKAPPCLVGFGISTPKHVRAAMQAGASGAISGSAIVRQIEIHHQDSARRIQAIETLTREMKAATQLG